MDDNLPWPDNYPLIRKNSRFDPHILRGHLWGEKVPVSVIGERQDTGGNGRGPSDSKGSIWSGNVEFSAE
jgi:hypothetical protein